MTPADLEEVIQAIRTLIDIVQDEYDELLDHNQVEMDHWQDAIRAGRTAIAKIKSEEYDGRIR